MATQILINEDLSVEQFYEELAKKGISTYEILKENPELIEELKASQSRLQNKAEIFNKNREQRRQRVETIKKKWAQTP